MPTKHFIRDRSADDTTIIISPSMAPSAVEVQATAAPVTVPAELAALKLQAAQNGPYKELAAVKYDAEAEAGLKGHKPAKVSEPTSKTTNRMLTTDPNPPSPIPTSTPITSRRGTATRSTRRSSRSSTTSTAGTPTRRTRTCSRPAARPG